MEIDFQTVRALSSPTRVKILSKVLEEEATPTKLSRELEKSKSTVSSHLSTLQEAELLEKDKKEGRKRVVYHPTRKAEAIIEGRERKIRFSLGSSALSTFIGLGATFYGAKKFLSTGSEALKQEAAMTASDSMNAMNTQSVETSSGAQNLLSPDLLLFIGIAFLSISVFSFLYGITMKKLDGSN